MLPRNNVLYEWKEFSDVAAAINETMSFVKLRRTDCRNIFNFTWKDDLSAKIGTTIRTN
jgi:hypothetical protein